MNRLVDLECNTWYEGWAKISRNSWLAAPHKGTGTLTAARTRPPPSRPYTAPCTGGGASSCLLISQYLYLINTSLITVQKRRRSGNPSEPGVLYRHALLNVTTHVMAEWDIAWWSFNKETNLSLFCSQKTPTFFVFSVIFIYRVTMDSLSITESHIFPFLNLFISDSLFKRIRLLFFIFFGCFKFK